MAYTINAGCLTRYSSFQPTLYLGSYFVQCNLNRGSYCSEVPIILSNLSQTEILQRAVMPKNFIPLTFDILIAKCVSKFQNNLPRLDRADQ